MKFEKNKINNCQIDIDNLSRETNLSNELCEILVNRKLTTKEEIIKFLSPSINDFHDPFLLKGMKECVNKIQEAILNKKRILIFGDYDVDGICAVSILYKYLKTQTNDVHYYLPNRYEDGYGLSMENCKKIITRFKPDLIITVDCGISCKDEVAYLMDNGIDVIVTDHHDIPNELPNTICINAKIDGQAYPFKGLCGAGVALKIVQAILGKENLDDYIAICSIATVADIVPLIDENRAIVFLGLKLTKKLPQGIQILLKSLNIGLNINSSDIAFKIAPRLNAAGRLGDAKIALKLFISNNKTEIYENIEKLAEMNTKRQELCNKIYKECIEKISNRNINHSRFIILQDKSWDSGLLGIVCARLVEEYNRPAFLFSNVDGILKGSVRSIPNINIHTALNSCSSTLETFGGHTVAAGLTLKYENYRQFINELDDYFNLNCKETDIECVKNYDMSLDANNINFSFLKEINLLEPFGCENPKPIFKLEWSNNSVTPMKNFPQHINVKLNSLVTLIGFNYSKYLEYFMYFNNKTALVEFQQNEYKGKTNFKGLIKAVDFSEYNLYNKDFFDGEYLKQFLINEKKANYTIENYVMANQLKELANLLKKSNFGTLIVVNSLKGYQRIKSLLLEYNVKCCIKNIDTSRGENVCVMNLSSFDNIQNYTNIMFIEGILSNRYLQNFTGTLFIPKDFQFENKLLNLDTNRETFVSFYKAFELLANKELKAKDEYSFFVSLKRMCPHLKNYDYRQFIACLYVFNELNIVLIEKNDVFSIKINYGVKTILDNSNIYKDLKLLNKLSR